VPSAIGVGVVRNFNSVLAKPRRFLLSSARFRAAIFPAGFLARLKGVRRASRGGLGDARGCVIHTSLISSSLIL